MTAREKQLVRESFRLIREDAGPLSMLFYGRLFQLDTTLRPMFHGDISRQGLKLMAMLGAVVESMDNFDALTPTLHAMAQRHTAYGVVSRHYGLVEQAFLWALRQELEVTSDSEVLRAWQHLIRQVSSTMQQGADQLKRN